MHGSIGNRNRLSSQDKGINKLTTIRMIVSQVRTLFHLNRLGNWNLQHLASSWSIPKTKAHNKSTFRISMIISIIKWYKSKTKIKY